MRYHSVQTLLASALRILTSVSSAAPLLTRLVFGQAFFLTGRGKWMNFENTVNFFAQIGIPFPEANAAFIASLEMIGGLLLIVGLGTRLISGLLGSTMVVALVTADKQSFLEALGSDLTGVTPVVYLLALVWLVLYGAGQLSLDTLLGRKIFQAPAKSPFLGNNHPVRAHLT